MMGGQWSSRDLTINERTGRARVEGVAYLVIRGSHPILATKKNRNLDPDPSSLTHSDTPFTITHPEHG